MSRHGVNSHLTKEQHTIASQLTSGAINCPNWWEDQEAFNTYQATIMQPLRDAMNRSLADVE